MAQRCFAFPRGCRAVRLKSIVFGFFLVIRAAAYDISPRALAVRKGLNAFIQQLLYRQQRGNRVTESGGLIRRDQGEHCDVLY